MSKQAGRLSQGANDFLAPYAPTIGTATNVGTSRAYNNGAATVTFTADGRNAADSFTVTSSPGGYTGTGSSSPVTVEGLQSNTAYTFTVTATNTYGTSAASSESNSITATTVPATPGAPSASSPTGYSPGTNSAGTTTDDISWSAPANGGSAITNYHWESNDSKSGDTGTATSASGISQEGGTTQAYRVYATNANGNSAWSDYSSNVTTFSFTPFSFAPFGFTPFGAFGFTPFGAFGFTPFGAFGFTPFGAFGFTPGSKYCVDQDTPVATVGPNDSVVQKPAKDIQVGDEIWAATFDEYIDELEEGYKGYLYSKTLTNLRTVKCTVQGIIPGTRSETVYFNGDTSKRFSLTERMLMKRNNIYQYIPSGDVVVGDIYLGRNADNTITEKPITEITKPTENRNVYRYSVGPVDHLFAGDMVVHNYK
jgi:hypothetical protein